MKIGVADHISLKFPLVFLRSVTVLNVEKLREERAIYVSMLLVEYELAGQRIESRIWVLIDEFNKFVIIGLSGEETPTAIIHHSLLCETHHSMYLGGIISTLLYFKLNGITDPTQYFYKARTISKQAT